MTDKVMNFIITTKRCTTFHVPLQWSDTDFEKNEKRRYLSDCTVSRLTQTDLILSSNDEM